MPAMPASVAEVVVRPITEWSEFSGRLRAVEDVAVRPRVSGVIESVNFKEGDMVEKGDKLITLDLRPYQAAYSQAKARADLMTMEASRGGRLFADKAIAKRELDEKNAAAKEAQAALELAALNLEYAEVLAPVSGRVGRIEITVGNMVDAGPGAPVLTTIQSLDPIYADFEIDEQTFLNNRTAENLGNIPVHLALANEKEFMRQGKILSFDNQLGVNTGTLRVRASFANPSGELTPGLFARVRMGSAQQSEAVLVNEQAIGTDLNKKFVYAVKDDGSVEYRELTLGGTADGLRIVKSGLKPGDKIVIGRLIMMHPGAKIIPQPVPMDTLKAPQEAAPAAGEAPIDAEKPQE
jgi:membrane fusion protein, multidrug efflux system